MRGLQTIVAMLEALRDVRVDREIIRPPKRTGTEAAQIVDGILNGVGGSWRLFRSPADYESSQSFLINPVTPATNMALNTQPAIICAHI